MKILVEGKTRSVVSFFFFWVSNNKLPESAYAITFSMGQVDDSYRETVSRNQIVLAIRAEHIIFRACFA